MKQVYLNLKWIPEFYFILVSILWFYLTFYDQAGNLSNFVNFPAIIVIVLFHIQLFLDDRVLGKFLAFCVALASFYLIFAMVNKLITDFEYDHNAQIFALQSGNLILMNFIMAFLMYNKYKPQTTEQIGVED